MPGYLGADSPEGFAANIQNETRMPCHKTVNYEADDWEEQLEGKKVQYCIGALIATQRDCKRPKDPAHAKAVDEVEEDEEAMDIEEFIEHHNNAPVKSWKF